MPFFRVLVDWIAAGNLFVFWERVGRDWALDGAESGVDINWDFVALFLEEEGAGAGGVRVGEIVECFFNTEGTEGEAQRTLREKTARVATCDSRRLR